MSMKAAWDKAKGAAWKHGERFHVKKNAHMIKKLAEESKEKEFYD